MCWVFILGILLGRGYRPENAVPQLAQMMPTTEANKLPNETPGSEPKVLKPEDLTFMKLFAYFPEAVLPNPRSALLICFGTGSTASALVEDRRLSSIDVVDISRDVLSGSRVVYPDSGQNPLSDPRVTTHDVPFPLDGGSRTSHCKGSGRGSSPPGSVRGAAPRFPLFTQWDRAGRCAYWDRCP